MNEPRTSLLAAPRRLVVGLLVLGAACHRAPPVPTPTPVPPARPAAPAAATISSAESLMQAIYGRYGSTWYKTLTFRQKTTLALPSGGELVQTWYEAVRPPGRRRIDTDLRSKTGTLFARDSLYSFSGGKLVRADSGLDELVVLGFDMYTQPAARTLAELRALGFDLRRFHEATWQGTPVYVIGANRGDSTSKQLWVERDRLLFVRMIERTASGTADTRVSQYAKYDGGWVAAEVTQIVNGKRKILEQYSDIHTNVTLSDGLFDPKQWSTAPHWVPR